MADDDERLTMAPAPLPRHERSWRHPSEIGQQRRASSRRPAPPLAPRVILLVGVLGLGLIAGLVALVMPREAPRESLPVVRNAALAPTPKSALSAYSTLGAMTTDGGRFVLAIDTPAGPRFVTTGTGRDVAIDVDGRPTRLEPVVVDDSLSVSVLRSATPTNFTLNLERAPDPSPSVGTSVVVRGSTDVAASIGVSVSADTTSFVPLAGDVLAVDVPESSAVEDTSGRLLGLYTERAGARGYVPFDAIDVLLSRSR